MSLAWMILSGGDGRPASAARPRASPGSTLDVCVPARAFCARARVACVRVRLGVAAKWLRLSGAETGLERQQRSGGTSHLDRGRGGARTSSFGESWLLSPT